MWRLVRTSAGWLDLTVSVGFRGELVSASAARANAQGWLGEPHRWKRDEEPLETFVSKAGHITLNEARAILAETLGSRENLQAKPWSRLLFFVLAALTVFLIPAVLGAAVVVAVWFAIEAIG